MIERGNESADDGGEKFAYVKPTLRVMTENEILVAFQMTAAKISAAGCWWGSCPTTS